MRQPRRERLSLRGLLLACLGDDLQPDPGRIALAVSSTVPGAWLALPPAADRHGVTLQVAAALADAPGVPGAILADVRRRALAHRAAQLRAHAALERLTPLLDDVAGSWAVLKGPVLADTVYRLPGRRSYSDLDVLVPPDRVRPAIAALEEAGFPLLTQNWRLMAERDTRELTFGIPNSGLDLHWHPLGAPSLTPGFRLSANSFLTRTRRVTLGATTDAPLEVPVLHRADAIVHLVVHMVVSGMGPLRYALDLDQSLAHASPPGLELRSALEAAGALLPFAVAVDRASRTLPRARERAELLVGPLPRGPWRGVAAAWSTWRPPHTAHESMPLDFLLASTRERSGASFAAARAALTPRVQALRHPASALERLRSGSHEGFSLDPFMQPDDGGGREAVLQPLDP